MAPPPHVLLARVGVLEARALSAFRLQPRRPDLKLDPAFYFLLPSYRPSLLPSVATGTPFYCPPSLAFTLVTRLFSAASSECDIGTAGHLIYNGQLETQRRHMRTRLPTLVARTGQPRSSAVSFARRAAISSVKLATPLSAGASACDGHAYTGAIRSALRLTVPFRRV